MDGSQFDNIARTLARGASRRALVRGLAGALSAAIAGQRVTDAAAAQRQPNGASCTRATDCASFRCVDGVCCDASCTGQCESCATGTCQPVVGAPVSGKPPCPGSGPCAATCDGMTTTHCAASPDVEVACGEPTCGDGWLTTYACAGTGSCVPTTTTCAPAGCNQAGTACADRCTSDADCAPGSHCDADACVADDGLGAACDEDSDCQTGFCVDSVCCVERCGACQVCNLRGNAGFCGPATDGTTCGVDDRCCAGGCVDIQADTAHCGGCGNTCPSGPCRLAVCDGGDCGTAADPAQEGQPCPDGICRDGACVPCGSDEMSCCTDEDCLGLFDTCGGGGVPGVCGCTPKTCATEARECSNVPDGCGNGLNCGGECAAELGCCAGCCFDNTVIGIARCLARMEAILRGENPPCSVPLPDGG